MSYELYAFDIDGTLIRSFLREGGGRHLYDEIEVLPGRIERLRTLVNGGARIALVTNQAGVPHGYQTEEQVEAKMSEVLGRLLGRRWSDVATLHVCYAIAHKPIPEDARAGNMDLTRLHRWDVARRKPSGRMILDAVERADTTIDRTIFVGDMESDMRAAESAGVDFRWAAEFFGDPR